MRQHGFPDARGLHGLTPAAPTRSRCRLLALFGHSNCTDERPLLGVKPEVARTQVEVRF